MATRTRKKSRDYEPKFRSFAGKTLFERLSALQQELLRKLAFAAFQAAR